MNLEAQIKTHYPDNIQKSFGCLREYQQFLDQVITVAEVSRVEYSSTYNEESKTLRFTD